MDLPKTAVERLAELSAGDKVRFAGQKHDSRFWYTVHARDDRFIVATRQATFQPKGGLCATIVDLENPSGLVRTSRDTLGGSRFTGEHPDAILPALQSGEVSLAGSRGRSHDGHRDHAAPGNNEGLKHLVCRGRHRTTRQKPTSVTPLP